MSVTQVAEGSFQADVLDSELRYWLISGLSGAVPAR